ncbi:MAG: hypothetical protein R3192_10725 [Woeseiaceae bacterium]|nr:hypothetical protein [Woeseiaceae bacterium]
MSNITAWKNYARVLASPKSRVTALSIVLVVALLSACANQSQSSMRGREIRIRYAQVIDVERVKMPSNAPAGAIVGGFTGLILSRNQSTGRQIASGVGGAALGGLATAALEGDRLGYQYRLKFADGSESQFITEKGYLQVEDCVSVERGQYANVRRVAKVLCAGGPATVVEETHIRDAQQCHAAKEQLLSAGNDEDIDQAARKVSILCQ